MSDIFRRLSEIFRRFSEIFGDFRRFFVNIGGDTGLDTTNIFELKKNELIINQKNNYIKIEEGFTPLESLGCCVVYSVAVLCSLYGVLSPSEIF